MLYNIYVVCYARTYLHWLTNISSMAHERIFNGLRRYLQRDKEIISGHK